MVEMLGLPALGASWEDERCDGNKSWLKEPPPRQLNSRVTHPDPPSGRAASLGCWTPAQAREAAGPQPFYRSWQSLGLDNCLLGLNYGLYHFFLNKKQKLWDWAGYSWLTICLAFSHSNQRKQDFKGISSSWWAWRAFTQRCYWPEWH